MGPLTVRMSGSLVLGPALGTLFLPLGCRVQRQRNGFCFIFSYFIFVILGCYVLEICSFLITNRKGVDPEGRGGVEELGGIEGEETIIIIDCVRKESFSISEKNKTDH